MITGLFLAGGIGSLFLLSTIFHLLVLTIKFILLYFIFKQLVKAKTTGSKIGLGILGIIILLSIFHHAHLLLGMAVLFILYQLFKKKDIANGEEKLDPFNHFEKQWEELNR